jgi:hypothetical protein
MAVTQLGPRTDDPLSMQTLYMEGWQPLEDRRWALAYVNEDGSEDFPAFVEEFRRRHPRIRVNQVDGYIPASVDHYLRHDAFGRRLDLDWELAATPLTPEEEAEQEKAKREEIREKRNAALRARGKLPGDLPMTAPAARKPRTIAERMESTS